MKKISIALIVLLVAGVNAFSQKKAGTVFSEHEAIDKTEDLWKAFVHADVQKYRSFFADSVTFIRNGTVQPREANAHVGEGLDYWKENYTDFSVTRMEPAYPDAIEYKEGGLWVQDWLLVSGIHKGTGIVLEMPLHNLYSFDKEGKITLMVQYYDNDTFEEIRNSQTTRENGKVYINHPYILTVRKSLNAFAAKDMEEWASYFSPKARFSALFNDPNQSIGLEEYWKAVTGKFFQEGLKFKMEQLGYPDCIYYEQSNQYAVYSWWTVKVNKNGKKTEFQVMISHDFDKEGKIVRQTDYVSSNHLDKF